MEICLLLGLPNMKFVIPDELVESFNLENSMCEISVSCSFISASFLSSRLTVKGRNVLVIVHPNVNLHNWATNLEMGEDPTSIFH